MVFGRPVFSGQRIRQSSLLAIAMALAVHGAAVAQQVIEDLDDPVRVELQTPLAGPNVPEGQAFSARLTEDLFYEDEGWKLPAGTVFSGHVRKAKESRVFNRPAYVILAVDQAILPDGKSFTFDPGKYDVRTRKLHNLDARSVFSTVLQQIPTTAVSTGTSIPLRTATDLNGGVIFAISMGARMLTGSVLGMTENRGSGSVPRAAAVGAFEATGLPRAYNFLFKKDKPLDLATGTEIKLHLDPDALSALFQSQNSVVKGY